MGNEGPFQDPKGPFGDSATGDPFGAPKGQRHAHDKDDVSPAGMTSDLADMPSPVVTTTSRRGGSAVGIAIMLVVLLVLGGIGAAVFFAVRTVDRVLQPIDDISSQLDDIPGFEMPDFEVPEEVEGLEPGEVWTPPSPEAQAAFLTTLHERLPKKGTLNTLPDAALVNLGMGYCQAAAYGGGQDVLDSLKQSDLGTAKDWARFERTAQEYLC